MIRRFDSPDDLLKAMVGFDTVNANISGRADPELPLAEFIEAHARDRGLDTARLPVAGASFNLLISHRVSAGAPWLLFESHLDTVSVEGMTIDPFAGRIESGRMYGRGACDTKASGAAMLWALDRYRQQAGQPNNVAILYTLDEEFGKTGARAFADRHLPTLDWRPAGVITGEPTELTPVVAHNGVVRWTISTRGVAAHSADPSQGRSAISMMLRVVDAIESRYAPSLEASHPMTGKAQCSVNVIRGGAQVNIIPDRCEVQVDRRLVPGEGPDAVLPAVEQLLAALRREHPDLHVEQKLTFSDPPLDPAGHEAFIGFVQHVLRLMSFPDRLGGVAYATDASTFSEVGIPAVVLGPGNIAQAHTKDEWLALSQLYGAVDVYHELMTYPLEGTA